MQIQKKVIIATHVLNYGAAHALRDYLVNKGYQLLFIGLPFYDQRNIIIENYNSGDIISKQFIKRKKSSGLKEYLADFYQVIRISLTQKQRYDAFVGVNNLNCLAGLLLKKVGKIKRVIYYAIDFTPARFSNPILNTIYHDIEIFCVKRADEVWNVSPRIAEGREKFLKIPEKHYKQKVIPIGVWNAQVKMVPFSKVKKHQILFVGHLLEKQGVQAVIQAIPDIVKEIHNFRFVIIGDGEYMTRLKKIVQSLHVAKYVVFTGWIFEKGKLNKIMGESACGVAIYKPEKEKLTNFTYYADPTKIKDYLSAGLPVILTNVPYNASELERKKCGIVVEYDKDKIAGTIVSLLRDPQKLQFYRKNAAKLAKEFDWNLIFSKLTI